MNILIIPDKFKFTFSSDEIGKLIYRNIQKYINAQIEQVSVSDGGEGFLQSIEAAKKTKRIYLYASNAVLKPVETFFLLENNTAYLELAKTSGLDLLKAEDRNPMYTSSVGLGEQINQAIKKGAQKIIIGLGGSATNDAGMGMASVLGFSFLDKKENILRPFGANMININKIVLPANIESLRKINFLAASDVENYLFGKNGAAFSFAAQKGASKDEIIVLDKGLKNISAIWQKKYEKQETKVKGDGAAGGLSFAIRSFLNGKIISGTDFIFSLLDIENKIAKADIIISGEGKLDAQSFNGKIVGYIYNLTKKYNKRLIIIAGLNKIRSHYSNLEIYSLFDSVLEMQSAKRQTPVVVEKILSSIFHK